jgi:nucleoid-associated protein YgaU
LTSPLDAVRPPTSYPRTSRYFGVETAIYPTPDGRGLAYLRRRLLPSPDSFTTVTRHVVAAGERPDLLAFRFLGDAEQWWRIADANPVLDPRELTAEPGRVVRITLPQGVPGGPRG